MKKIVILVVMMIIFSGCKNDISLPKEKDILLLDYYYKVVGIEEDNPYYEIVLYSLDGNNIKMEVIENENLTTYHIPKEAYQKAKEIIKKYKMSKWNDMENSICIDGVSYICKYLENDKYIRVTSEAMSEDGLKAFGELEILLNEYIDEKYRNE